METRGTLKDALRAYDGRWVLTFTTDNLQPDALQDITGKDLDITAKVHREKRSLNANSFFHQLVTKIAEKAGTSNTHEKNRCIREYGQWEVIDGKIPTIKMKPEYEDRMLDIDGLHVKVVRRDPDGVVFGLMRGSHTYDTKEMARLIDGTVQDAKALGIETLTPDKLERMKAAWKGKGHEI